MIFCCPWTLWAALKLHRFFQYIKRSIINFCLLKVCYVQWIGLRENLQETIDFPIKYGAFRFKFSLKPIHWYVWFRKGIAMSGCPILSTTSLWSADANVSTLSADLFRHLLRRTGGMAKHGKRHEALLHSAGLWHGRHIVWHSWF